MAKLTWLDSGVDLDLLHALVENAHAATIPAYPDLVTDQFGGNFIEGASHFDVTVAMNVAPRFLKAGKKRVGQRLEMRTLLMWVPTDVCVRCRSSGQMSTSPIWW